MSYILHLQTPNTNEKNYYVLHFSDLFQAIEHISKKYGFPCNLWIGHHYHYVTADADDVRVILNSPHSLNKMSIYNIMGLLMADTLLLLPAEEWKLQRKFFSKSFSQPILNSFVEVFYKKTSSLLNIIKEAEEVDVFDVFEQYTIDAFCETIIGLDYDMQNNPQIKIAEWLGDIQTISGKYMVSGLLHPDMMIILTAEGRKVIQRIKQTKAFIRDIIKRKRKAFGEDSEYADKNALPLLDAMLHAKEGRFNDEKINQELILFALAATDTSGYTLAYVFTLLGMHPDIQEKVYDEVISVVGRDRPIYNEDLPNLKYVERCILESMRILPVTPFIGRMAMADLTVGSKIIPKGTNLFVSMFDLHRNEKYWPEPLIYNPDRFLPEEVAKRDPYAFIPFSAGPRNCIGKTYAMMLMKTVVASVIRNYKVFSNYQSVTELKFSSCITMKTRHHLDCRFKPRSPP
ncbi:hypothetical protein GWI33_012196 [Rhynchophorus ferrugineus]|uniref:Cytochrome P450 n=1 Tax=Rhynchophorus ferrugineus TaxID=354439 RepID=A0A834IAH8_RHYFE|nr:hypothetical protein GWI33_012196 [Rhynchophorus ferrugineus]